MVFSQIPKFCKQKIQQNLEMLIQNLQNNDIKFPVHKKDYAKIEKQIIFPLIYLVIKMEHHNTFILQIKLLKNLLIYYYLQILKILIMV